MATKKKEPTTEEKVAAIIALIKLNGWSLPAILEDTPEE